MEVVTGYVCTWTWIRKLIGEPYREYQNVGRFDFILLAVGNSESL